MPPPSALELMSEDSVQDPKHAQASTSREPSPNRGSSTPAVDAIPKEREDLATWKKRQGIDSEKQVKLVRISHMRYQHVDLEKITTFLRDFGMHVVRKTPTKVWFGGYGPDHYVYEITQGASTKFLGGSYIVESYADLEKAALIPGAGPIEDLADAPGGGQRVTIVDPEGFPVNVVWGQTEKEEGAQPEKLVYNFEREKGRVNTFQRFREGPAAVHKLGHYGLCVRDFPTQMRFYTTHFNLAPTDFLYVPTSPTKSSPRKDVAIFAHIDRGDTYVDHHTFFMTTNATEHVHHCSFEVHDFDTQLLGHQWLAEKGYESVWGVGRHILGSQIFDYWWDTSGFMIEHYADGDQINQSTPIGWGPAGDEALAVWGPKVPKTFLE